MNYPFLVIAGLAVLFTACKQKNHNEDAVASVGSNADSAKLKEPYFPVATFLKNEIDYVDSLPVGIMKYHTVDNRTDSSYIKSEEFHRMSAEFLSPELKDSSFMNHFTETSLYDQTTKTATFLYNPVNKESPVQRIDVVTEKGDIYDEVKSIYIEKRAVHGNHDLLKKMYWKPKRNFQIVTISSDSSGRMNTELVKVVWDNRE